MSLWNGCSVRALLFRLEEQLDAKVSDPGFLYEALKVYLMLGGLHPSDRELIKSWMRRDWAENLYPGASNAEGRKLLEDHLDAMLDLETGSPLIELNGRLIEESEKALARLSIAQRAYELLIPGANLHRRGLGRRTKGGSGRHSCLRDSRRSDA